MGQYQNAPGASQADFDELSGDVNLYAEMIATLPTKTLDNTNLDTVRTNGAYLIGTGCTNTPPLLSTGKLVVMETGNANYTRQFYIGGYGVEMYTRSRYYSNSTWQWTSWQKILLQNDFSKQTNTWRGLTWKMSGISNIQVLTINGTTTQAIEQYAYFNTGVPANGYERIQVIGVSADTILPYANGDIKFVRAVSSGTTISAVIIINTDFALSSKFAVTNWNNQTVANIKSGMIALANQMEDGEMRQIKFVASAAVGVIRANDNYAGFIRRYGAGWFYVDASEAYMNENLILEYKNGTWVENIIPAEMYSMFKPSGYTAPTNIANNLTRNDGGYVRIGNMVVINCNFSIGGSFVGGATLCKFPPYKQNPSISARVYLTSNLGKSVVVSPDGSMDAPFDMPSSGYLIVSGCYFIDP